MKTVAIIQARMGSSRLPGKVLRLVDGQPMLCYVVRRAARAQRVDELVVATTTGPADEPIAAFCRTEGLPCFRGSETDVLDRYYRAARQQGADAIVRITGDCPLIDPEVIDRVVEAFQQHQPKIDYAANIIPRRTYPRGLDTEVFRFDALKRAWREARDPESREHVTAYLYRNPDRFRLLGVLNENDLSAKRWTVDTEDDLRLVCAIVAHFGHDRFSWHEVLDAYQQHPEWLEINKHVVQKAA